MPDWIIGQNVPWNAGWSSEEAYEVRNCRWVGGKLALWQPHSPGEGRPIFAKPHSVRQRRSIVEMRCTVCGEKTPTWDRWWFGLGAMNDGLFMTTEAPVHRTCADLALQMCPHIKHQGLHPERMPPADHVLYAVVGGPATERDFGVNIAGRKVAGHMKLAWRPTEALALALRVCGRMEQLAK